MPGCPNLLRCALAALVSVAWADDCNAGAWTQAAGSGIVIATLARSEANERFDQTGQRTPFNFKRDELRVFGEFGLTDAITLLGQANWRDKTFDSFPAPLTARGFGRFEAGARFRLHQSGAWVFSAQGSVFAPGTRSDPNGANAGDTDWQLDGRLLAGRGFELLGRHGFTDMQVGYRHRFGEPASELRFDTTLGVDVTPKLLVMLQSFNTISVDDAASAVEGSLQPKIALSAAYKLRKDWRIQLGADAVPYGRNALNERGVFAAIWKSF